MVEESGIEDVVQGDGIQSGEIGGGDEESIEVRWNKAIQAWLQKLRLTDWVVYTKVEELSADRWATTNITEPYRRATVVLSDLWVREQPADITVRKLSDLALHEVCHMAVYDVTHTMDGVLGSGKPSPMIPTQDGAYMVQMIYTEGIEALVDWMATLVGNLVEEDK